MQRILALDPGETTGWATWSELEEPWESPFNCGQIGPQEHHLQLDSFLGHMQVTNFTVVCERFEYRNQSRAGLNLMSREYIGVVKRFAQERMIDVITQKVVFQNATQAVGPKSFVQDSHVKRLGLWTPNQRHAMDATRHLLYYIIHSGYHTDLANTLLERAWK